MRPQESRIAARRMKQESGSVGLELLGTMGFVVIMVLFAWQALLSMHALSQANTAARDAARAASISSNSSGEQAGENALSESLQPGSTIDCGPGAHGGVECTASVNIPILSIGGLGDAISVPPIERTATMPKGEEG